MSEVVLLHDLGAPDAGASWRAAAPDGWHVPDLPGHGETPAPRHGAYDPTGPLTLARWALAAAPDTSLAIGVGQNAHAALILAVGGGCGAVAIVDGLWGPWLDPDDAVDEMYTSLRALLDDPGATQPPPPSGLDPRARHGYGVTVSSAFAQKFWGAAECPVLAIETPGSTTPPNERAERVSWFGGSTTWVELNDRSTASVIGTVVEWQPSP